MKRFLTLLTFILLIMSCQKSALTDTQNAGSVSSDALVPLKYHATSLLTAYPDVKGQLPPFQFVKTLYPDTRVSRLQMTSRNRPKGETDLYYYKWDFNFNYTKNAAHTTGYIDWYGGADRHLVQHDERTFDFIFNNQGYCTEVFIHNIDCCKDNGTRVSVFQLTYSPDGKRLVRLYDSHYGLNLPNDGLAFTVTNDANGNITKIESEKNPAAWTTLKYTYDLKSTGKNYVYQPSQYAISMWYSFLETMQWVPLCKNARTTVTLSMPQYGVSFWQKYINNKYDVNGNLISYTYGDNVLQKVTWK